MERMMDLTESDEYLVEKLRKELADLARKEEEPKQILKRNQYKIQALKKERDEIKLVLEKDQIAIAKKEEELNHCRDQAELFREKADNLRQQNLVDQMRKAEVDEQIEELKKTLEEVKLNGKASQEHIMERLKAAQNKMLSAPWVVSRRKEEEELASVRKQIEEMSARKEQLQQSIQQAEATLAENREVPFKKFCVASAALALKSRAYLKRLARERIVCAKIQQQLSEQGQLDTSLVSQLFDQSQQTQNHPREVGTERVLPRAINVGVAETSEEMVSGASGGGEKIEGIRILNFQDDEKNGTDNHKKANKPSAAADNKLEENVKLVVIDQEIEKTVSESAMETDESNEGHQIGEESTTDAVQSEEATVDLNEKGPMLDDLNIDISQISDKIADIDSDFAANFADDSGQMETAVAERSEGRKVAGGSGGKGILSSSNSLLPAMKSASDPDPSNLFGSFTHFAPNAGNAINLSNTNLAADGEFDASAIFNLSAVVQNQSIAGGGNDYMALFEGATASVEETQNSNDGASFMLNFNNFSDAEAPKNDDDNFFNF